MKADLHMHTTHSDGRLTNEELFKRAKANGVDVIAITDHDICCDVEKNQELSKKYGVKYIPGIEFSTLCKGKSVHVLGYFTDDSYNSDSMKEYYKRIKEGREKRAQTFIRSLKKYFDIEISYDQLIRLSGGIIARPHIARAIMENYPEYTHNDIFDQFIGDHCKAYAPSTELTINEGLKLLKSNNAITVLAHPVLLKPYIHDDVLAHSFDGIEAIYCLNSEENTKYYKSIAEKRKLLITAGGDYHGIEKDTKHCDIGEVVLEGEALKSFLQHFE